MIGQLFSGLKAEGRHMSFHRIYIVTCNRTVAVSENIDGTVLKCISPDDHFHRVLLCRRLEGNPRNENSGCQKKGAKTPPMSFIHLLCPPWFLLNSYICFIK